MPPTLAWHSPHEEPNVKFASSAGDPAYDEESADCRDRVAEQGLGGIDCVVLYGHPRTLLTPVPLNAQRPAACAEDLAQGFTGTPGIEPFWTFSRLVLYSSPGFAEYGGTDCQPLRTHPERGLAADLRISPDVDIKGHWYLSADTLEFSPLGIDTDVNAGAMPCVTVKMTLQTGRFAGVGQILAQGQTTKTILTVPEPLEDLETPPVPDPCIGSEGTIDPSQVTEFEVNLGLAAADVPEPAGFIVIVHWYQHNYGGDDPGEETYIIQREWNLHTGPEYAPRVILPVEATHDARIRLAVQDEVMRIRAKVDPVLGSYDVDEANARLRLYDAFGHEVDVEHLIGPQVVQDLDVHFSPVAFTWRWDAAAEAVPPGEYTWRFAAPNWQHTVVATAEAGFSVQPDGATVPHSLGLTALEAPAVPLLGLLVAAALSGLAARRRLA